MNHAFAFAAEAGIHLLTPEGWKAELALYVFRATHKQWYVERHWSMKKTLAVRVYGKKFIFTTVYTAVDSFMQKKSRLYLEV